MTAKELAYSNSPFNSSKIIEITQNKKIFSKSNKGDKKVAHEKKIVHSSSAEQ